MAGIKAQININRGNDGKGEASNVFNKILDELKKLTQIQTKTSKLSMSGLLGTGGGILGLSKGLLGALGGLGTLSGDTIQDPNFRAQSGIGKYYESIYDPKTGERSILEIDAKNNEILRILTEEQAQKEGILDSTKKIKKDLDTNESYWDKITKDMPKWKESVILSNENLAIISNDINTEKLIQADINGLLTQKREILRKHVASLGGDSVGYNESSIALEHNMSVRGDDPWLAARYGSTPQDDVARGIAEFEKTPQSAWRRPDPFLDLLY